MTDLQLIHASFDLWLAADGEDNRAELERVKRILPMILEECCTAKQLDYIMRYYADGMKIKEIAKLYDVNKSTVSRTIHAGIDKAYPYLRFCSPLFIKAPQKRGHLRQEKKRGESWNAD